MNTGFVGLVIRSLLQHVTLGHDFLLAALGLAYFQRLADSMVDGSFHHPKPNRWKQFLRRIRALIVAQPRDPHAVEEHAASTWLGRFRRRRSPIRSQFAIALTVVLVGCLYLPRRLVAPVASQGLRPVPIPVPAPTSAILLPAPNPQLQDTQTASTASSTRVAQSVPALLSQSSDRPSVELAPLAPAIVQGEGAGEDGVEPDTSTQRAPIANSSTTLNTPAKIDPIYRFDPEALSQLDVEGMLLQEPYRDELNPTIRDEFVSRPPMFGWNLLRPIALSTPVPSENAVPQFASRPPMGGLSILREEIDKARTSLSFQVDAGADTGLAPRTPSGPGSLWPTFEPPSPISEEHFWLDSPFPGGFNQLYSPGYQFGSTGGGRYRIHHGVDIGNPVGTPVLATASGEVVHAGPDNPTLLGPYNDFYGNSVVIRLDRKLNTSRGEQDVFVLYGHLVSVDVQEGQWVGAGDYLGGVGMTGIAIGPHLHMEVRIGQNSYLHTVNPALWMRPAAYTGTVAVRLLSAAGRTWPVVQLSLYRYEETGVRWYRVIETYPEQESIGPDPSWGENGALSHIPIGTYLLSGFVNGEEVRQEITVRDGETTFVELRTQQ
ncbi:MAG: peptidoglycan DD-metalloendopeptidase family protein [Caldilineaceae bacterium SB0661_bin_32]|uniref:Peptidoglycan DD-metalloendopeptidase family protein n=1 Tax=Caldilineaceae bacterium SB0661_bin_32 TaxID=2605255 RepID=A0A6B1DB91_9CHLR|nr:peptidoglycan DD-metalloendopeptidase family protein [Caldilineaceae bacterium SB0661_bin_32]